MIRKFGTGDLVFARIKGYPAWPARVTSSSSCVKYTVFFYGTFEEGSVKPEDMWPYNKKYLKTFGSPKSKKYKKSFEEALYQIQKTPEIAVQEGEDKDEFAEGDLVFARVKGSPVWPARVISKLTAGYSVFFYGTFEKGITHVNDMWPYSHKYLDRLGPLDEYNYKKSYNEALYQIQHCPDIAVQELSEEFLAGDLVFARVQGYPPWPARVTSVRCAGKYSAWVRPQYSVFLYGLCEVGKVYIEDLWPYTQIYLTRLRSGNSHKKWYSEGLYQIENTPEIATQRLDEEEDAVHDGDKIRVLEQNNGIDLIQDLTDIHLSDTFGGREDEEMSISEDEDVVIVEDLEDDATLNKINRNDVTIVVNQQDLATREQDVELNYEKIEKVEQNICRRHQICLNYPTVKMRCKLKAVETILQYEDSLLETEIKQELGDSTNISKMEAREKLLLKKSEQLEWLKTEQRLLDILCQIHKSLRSRGGDDLAKCVEMLKLMEEVDIKPLMVIKMPEVFTTVKMLVTGLGLPDLDITEEIVARGQRIRQRIVKLFSAEASFSSDEFDGILQVKVNDYKRRNEGESS